MRNLVVVLVLSLTAFAGAKAERVTYWNASQRPIAFALYNANDSGARDYESGFNTAYLLPCAKVVKVVEDGGLLQGFRPPQGKAFQVAMKEVGEVNGKDLRMCVDAEGKATGQMYSVKVEGKLGFNGCYENRSTVTTYPAPELVRASGNLPALQSQIDLDFVGDEHKPMYIYMEDEAHMCHN